MRILLFTSLFSLFFLLPAGCSQIRFNWAMEEVNERYTELFYDIETKSFPEIRSTAWRLVDALSHPTITRYRQDQEYLELLEKTNEATGTIIWESASEEREVLIALRSRLSQTCQSCHDRLRR